MNSSAFSPSQSAETTCKIDLFLGGRLGPITTQASAVLLVIAVVNVITCPFTIVSNGLVIVAVNSKPRLQSKSNLALACLATTEWIMGVLGQPLFIPWIIIILHGHASNGNCFVTILSKSVIRILALASMIHLALLNVERYIAIKHAFKYIHILTKARTIRSSAFVWITTLLLTIPFAVVHSSFYISMRNFLVLLSMAVIIFCQLVLYFETHRHENQMAVQQVSVESRRKFLEEKKALKVTTSVLFTLLLTYAPIILARVLGGTAVMNTVNIMHIVFFSAISMTVLNSVINPISYCLTIRHFRVAFMEIIFRQSNRKAEENENQYVGKLETVSSLEEGLRR